MGPAFSPDGSKLAYVAYNNHGRQRGVFVANADGSGPRAVTSWSGQFSWEAPAWSPDGRRLALTLNTLLSASVGRQDIVVVGADGSGERVVSSTLSPRGSFSDPVWSPDGRFIAFARYPSGALVVVGAQGGRLRVVAHNIGGLAWRPAVALPAANRPRCHTR